MEELPEFRLSYVAITTAHSKTHLYNLIMKSTTRQLKYANELHNSGVPWKIIASYLFTNVSSLKQQMEDYVNTTTR